MKINKINYSSTFTITSKIEQIELLNTKNTKNSHHSIVLAILNFSNRDKYDYKKNIFYLKFEKIIII